MARLQVIPRREEGVTVARSASVVFTQTIVSPSQITLFKLSRHPEILHGRRTNKHAGIALDDDTKSARVGIGQKLSKYVDW